MVRELNIDLNRESGRSTYRRLAAAIRRAIHKGTLFPGDLLPSTRSLGETLGIHRHTVTAALQELVAEGWLEPIARKGYRVCTVLPTVFTRAQRTPLFAPTQRLSITLKKQLTIDGTFPDRGFRFAFQSGKPDLRIFPIDDFRRQLAECLKKGKTETLDYTDPAGFPPLVKEIGDYLRRVRGVKDRAIIVTHGSQEAIFIIAQLLLSPGDCVGVEGLGYPPAWQALRAAGAQLIPLAIDEEGLVPAALEEAVQRHNLRLLYTTALHQYPTTATMPVTRRSEIYSIAHRHKLPILEDDYDHEFHFRSHPLAPLAASDPAGIVLYVSTFSKVLFPAARIGFLAIPPD
ncbi:MAG: PLP-dependent aminotransferase family protein, partial [Deltaproteobacteria bacterium]|nr:PLP-dependent aminotransferase family protein [Deltaproteobacteria bacterium]